MASPSSLRAWYARERLKCAGPHMHRLTCLLCAASLKRTAVCCVGRDSVWDQSLALREFINISSLRFSLYCRGLIDDDGIPTLVRADKDEVELRLKTAVRNEIFEVEFFDGVPDECLIQLSRCNRSKYRQPLGVNDEHVTGDPA